MANNKHLKIFKQGAKTWNEWRVVHSKVEPNLSKTSFVSVNFQDIDFRGANLRGADLTEVDLVGLNLQGADLRECDLRGAYFWETNLQAANLSKAFLGDTNFNYVNMENANLVEMSLVNTHLFRSDLRGADLSYCMMGGTLIADMDLSTAQGLESVDHRRPSTIGIDTIYRSGGNIPEVFLRGAGVPESFVAQAKSLVAAMAAIEFYSCFISFSSRDAEFVTKLHADLTDKGVRCWFAPYDLKIGQKLRCSFDEAIRLHDKVLVILSENSVASPWVEKEVETAFEKERQQNRTVLFPIRLDDAVMKTSQAWAADIRRTRHIGDFRRWENTGSYERALNRLMRDLKAYDKTN